MRSRKAEDLTASPEAAAATFACARSHDVTLSLPFPVPMNGSLSISFGLSGPAAETAKVTPNPLVLPENSTVGVFVLHLVKEGQLYLSFALSGKSEALYEFDRSASLINVACPKPDPSDPSWWRSNSPWAVPVLITLSVLIVLLFLWVKRRRIQTIAQKSVTFVVGALRNVNNIDDDVEVEGGLASTEMGFFNGIAEEPPDTSVQSIMARVVLPDESPKWDRGLQPKFPPITPLSLAHQLATDSDPVPNLAPKFCLPDTLSVSPAHSLASTPLPSVSHSPPASPGPQYKDPLPKTSPLVRQLSGRHTNAIAPVTGVMPLNSSALPRSVAPAMPAWALDKREVAAPPRSLTGSSNSSAPFVPPP